MNEHEMFLHQVLVLVHLYILYLWVFLQHRTSNSSKHSGVIRTFIIYLYDYTGKKGKILSTPLYSTFKLIKHRKNVKLATFLMETSWKVQK